MALVGRDDDIDRILFTLRHTRGVLVCGDAGVGKSALAAAVAARLPNPPVGRIVATAAGRSVPFGALAPLLPHDHVPGAAALVPVRIAERLAEGPQPGPPRRPPPVLLIDDVQELDEPSAAALLALSVADTVRLLGTLRTGRPVPDAVTALWKEDLVFRVDLGPLDLDGTGALLADILGGSVASPAVAALHRLSEGNPLHLTELARFGRSRDRFVLRGDRWWWLPGRDVPPRLGELLLTRVASLTSAGRQAAELLALGEPLPYDALAALSDPDAVDELDRAGLIAADDAGGVLTLRFSHPLLQTVTEAQVSPTRRRTLCRLLQQVPADHVDVVRQATWQLAGGGAPRIDIVLAAVETLLATDPDKAEQLASRAAEVDGSATTMVALAHVRAERGELDAAGAALGAAAGIVADDGERLGYLLEELSESLWLLRDPLAALTVADRMRADLPSAFAGEAGSSRALALAFTGRLREAIQEAEDVLASSRGQSARIRALTALLAGRCFGDSGEAALAVADQLERELAAADLPATRVGLVVALIAACRTMHGAAATLGIAGPLGRWPSTATQAGGRTPRVGDEFGWPLLVGLRNHLSGDVAGALDPLREAVVQQLAGEGVFRSEAIAELVVVLSELHRVDEAERVLSESPPDGVGIIAGLGDWAAAGVAGATWQRERATALGIRAAEAAWRGGAALMAWTFLTDVGRWGHPHAADRARRDLGLEAASPSTRARAADIAARASNRPAGLVAAAEMQLQVGFHRHAVELAEQARTASVGGAGGAAGRGVERAAAAVLAAGYARLGRASVRAPRSVRLTAREAEVAHLAAGGSTDREIADRLTLSVRTVHSHLAAAYRKLGITSRADLAGALGDAHGPDGASGP